jgi:hypothetical protein
MPELKMPESVDEVDETLQVPELVSVMPAGLEAER